MYSLFLFLSFFSLSSLYRREKRKIRKERERGRERKLEWKRFETERKKKKLNVICGRKNLSLHLFFFIPGSLFLSFFLISLFLDWIYYQISYGGEKKIRSDFVITNETSERERGEKKGRERRKRGKKGKDKQKVNCFFSSAISFRSTLSLSCFSFFLTSFFFSPLHKIDLEKKEENGHLIDSDCMDFFLLSDQRNKTEERGRGIKWTRERNRMEEREKKLWVV